MYKELYHSESGAALEANSLYIESSGLLDVLASNTRTFNDKVNVFDVGLGLGYNALSTLSAWFESPGKVGLDLYSLEIDAELFFSLMTACAPWQINWSSNWLSAIKKFQKSSSNLWLSEFNHPLSQKSCRWYVILADATVFLEKQRDFLPMMDFIWQDPFSPKKCPKLWDHEWFKLISDCAHEGSVLMTYSVASSIRRALEMNGWSYHKISTPIKKKSWLKAIKK